MLHKLYLPAIQDFIRDVAEPQKPLFMDKQSQISSKILHFSELLPEESPQLIDYTIKF